MEILSTGQKIKRARIYKGITLKELCKDQVSISKMSCIENGKVKADSETIRYISDIVQVDYDYLMQDIYEQISHNLQMINEGQATEKELEENVNINLAYSMEYKYHDLSLELLHILFSYYIDNEIYDKCESLISKYYAVYEKYHCDKATITYYLDMAKYLFKKGEYYDAIVYYSRLRELNVISAPTELETYIKVVTYEAISYFNLEEYGRSYELLKSIISLPIHKKINYSKIYHYYAATCIMLGYKDVDKYIEKSYQYIIDNNYKIAYMKQKYSECYFKVSEKEKALKEMKEAKNIFPTENNEEYVNFLNISTEILYNNSIFDKALELINENLNNAISTTHIKLIEKAYYLKGMILSSVARFDEAEMYLNLSLDTLYKFGSKKERKQRYLDMAYLYYMTGNYKDSIKYFNFSVEIDKTM